MGPINYNDFIDKMKKIKEMGWIRSHRKGDTGIGKTLEDLLGISENNIAGPDFSTYELKSARKNSVSMLTLFTKAPLPSGANRELLKHFGYVQRKKTANFKQTKLYKDESAIPLEDKELHVTVDSKKPNSVGLKLSLAEDRLYIENDKGVEAYYDSATLKEAFEKKYHSLIYVLADNKFEKKQEFFWFNEVYLLENFDFEKFSNLVEEGIVKIDIRIGHYPDGRIHDHGTGFRILPKYLPKCFEKIEKVL